MQSGGGFLGGSSSASNSCRKYTRVASVLLAGSLQTISTLSATSTRPARPARLFIDIPEFKPPPMCLNAWVAAQQAWAQLAVEAPSTDSSSGVKVHILGIAHDQSVNCKLISGVMRELKPDVVAIEGFDDYKRLFVGENSIGNGLDTQLDLAAAASWRDHGTWTSMVKCERVLSLDQLCSWHQTLDAAHESHGLDAFNEAGFLADSELVAASRGAVKSGLKVYFVDCDLQSIAGQNSQRASQQASLQVYNAYKQSSNAKLFGSDVERVGLCPETVSEIQDWVSTHSSSCCREQLARFVCKSTSPSTFKLSTVPERVKSSFRVCGVALLGGSSQEEIDTFQRCVVESRDQYMYSRLVGIAQSLPPPKTSWRLRKPSPRKVLFICGQGHVAGIQKLFEDNK